jgi:sn-1 stearoyl-lipid 9-desaturase
MSEDRDAFRVNSLAGLEHASPVEGEVIWDPVRSIWNSGMFLAAAILGPLTFSWSALVVFLVTAGVTLCAGHSVGFHRRLIHRSFDCPKWLEYTLIWLGTLVGMGGPIWTMRLHDMGAASAGLPLVPATWQTASDRWTLLSELSAQAGAASGLRTRARHRR